MKWIRHALVSLSLVLLGAHFLRFGHWGLAGCAVGLVGLQYCGRAWARNVLLVALLAGLAVWFNTTWELVHLRQTLNLPWTRLFVIMAGVTGGNLLAFLMLLDASSLEGYAQGREEAATLSVVFILVFAFLYLLSVNVPLPLLLSERYLPGSGPVQAFALSLYAVWVASRLLEPSVIASTRLRIWLGFSTVFFVQLLLGLAGMEEMLMTGKLHLPVPALIIGGPLYRGSGFFMPILYGSTLILVGSAWCSHLCYIGAWDGLASRYARKRPTALPAWARWGRGVTLAGTVLAAITLRLVGADWFVAVFVAGAFGLAGVGMMVAWSAKVGVMTHCTVFCPIGLVSSLAGRIHFFKMRIADDCDRCGVCSRACRYNALTAMDLQKGRPGASCTLCGDCLGACKHGRIAMSCGELGAQRTRHVFVGIVVVLHAVFMGVARI